ncbi:MlaD family protein, partial [bacterium]|nr:MlaD family protein [bacterium]
MKKGYLLFILFISFVMASTYELIISLDDYNGLRPGSKVIYNQQNIGKVKRIFEEEEKYTVVLKIYQEYQIKEDTFLFKVDDSSNFPSILVEENNISQFDDIVIENLEDLQEKENILEEERIEEEEREAWLKAKEEAKLEAERLEEEERKKWEEKKKQEEWEKKRKIAADNSPYKGDVESIKIFQASNNLNADGFWGKKSQMIYDSLLIVKLNEEKIKKLKKQQEAIKNADKGDAALLLEKEYLDTLKKNKKERIRSLRSKLMLDINMDGHLYNDKDQFETSGDFFVRATNTSLNYYDSLKIIIDKYFNDKIRPIEKEFENVLDKTFSSKEIDIYLGDYDADQEIFPIKVKDLKNNKSYNRKIAIEKKRARELYNNWTNVKVVGLFSLRFDGTVYLNNVYVVDEKNSLEYSFIINEKEVPSIVSAKYFDLNIKKKDILMLRKPDYPEVLSYNEIDDPYLSVAISLKDNIITYFTEVNVDHSSFTGEDYGIKGVQTRLNVNGKTTFITSVRPNLESTYYNTSTSFNPIFDSIKKYYNDNPKDKTNYKINMKAIDLLSTKSLSKTITPFISNRLNELSTFINYFNINGEKLIINNYNNSQSDSHFSNVDCYWDSCIGFKNYITNYLNDRSKGPKSFYIDSGGDIWGIFTNLSGNKIYKQEVYFYNAYYNYTNVYRYKTDIDLQAYKIKLNNKEYYSFIKPSSDGITINFPFLFDLDYYGYNLSSEKVLELRKNFVNKKTEELKKLQGNKPDVPIEVDDESDIEGFDS